MTAILQRIGRCGVGRARGSGLAPKVNGGAEEGGGDGGAVDPKRVEFHRVFFDEPDDEPAFDGDEEPADEDEFFDARVAAREVLDPTHFLDEPAIVVGRRAAGDELKKVGDHGAAEITGKRAKRKRRRGNEEGF